MRSDDLALALELADLADAITTSSQGDAAGSSRRKADRGLVTDIDIAVEKAIRTRLADARPGDAVVGEELGSAAPSARTWSIDPIDGTVAYIDGSDRWSTLIALQEGDRPVVGVVSRPAAHQRWWAADGLGAYRNGSMLRVSRTSTLAAATVCEDFRYSIRRGLSWNPLVAVAAECHLVHDWDDPFDFLRIAEGSVDVIVGWYAGKGLDLAPFVTIVREAGGTYSDRSGDPNLSSDVHVVTNGVLHDEVLRILRHEIAARRADPSLQPGDTLEEIEAARRGRAR